MKIYCDTQHNDPNFWVDKPYWVKCILSESPFGTTEYVQLFSSDSGISYRSLLDFYIDDYDEDNAWESGMPSMQISYGRFRNNLFTVCQPIEALTNEEFSEILSNHDTIYEALEAEFEDENAEYEREYYGENDEI